MDAGQTSNAAPAAAGNSSDFVRKLYKMLEDPSYSEIVRWGDDGDSFVVLECEKFTKTILPKHFKHSNFASFVRQLNKYDFHKVRQNNEESGQSPYGQNAWEFKHPEFRANSKDSLDNIRRKAPAPRKPAQPTEETAPTQQIDLLNQQVMAQQQQIQHISDRYAQLSVDHQLMLQEVMRVQKNLLNHENVMHQLMTYLLSIDARQRRDGKAAGAAGSFPGQTSGGSTVQTEDVPATPLQQASKLLSDMNADIQFNLPNMDAVGDPQKAAAVAAAGAVPLPPMDGTARNGAVRPPTSAAQNAVMAYAKMNNELEGVVYPVGATNGIDPMYTDHVGNVPYPMPTKEVESAETRRQAAENRKKGTHVDPGWMRSPHILLVEDDATCRQIGGKFLYSFQCVIDTALDGLEAVNKIQNGAKYDMILMDIIMPNLDGVSACHLIRQFDRTPIIAMTSNIRSDDIQLYFQHGMDDVLPKPFTRKSLLDMLEKHLDHLKTTSSGMEPPPSAAAVTMAAQGSTAHSIKEDSSPGQSPAANALPTWTPPPNSQFHPGLPTMHPGVAPVQGQFVPAAAASSATPVYGVDQNGNPYPANQAAMNATVAANAAVAAAAAARPQHRRQISDMSSAADGGPGNGSVGGGGGGGGGGMNKRPRMYGHPSQQLVATIPSARPG